jgi:hypothetical protein
MNRYEFEDAISAYIENELSLARRREFESYLKQHPEARDLVESVKRTKQSLNQLPPIKVSSDFMTRLERRKAREKDRSSVTPAPTTHIPKTILRLPPLYAGLMSALVITFIVIGIQLLPTQTEPGIRPPQYSKITPPMTKPVLPPQSNPALNNTGILAESEQDSTDSLINAPKHRFPLDDRIRLVKDQH